MNKQLQKKIDKLKDKVKLNWLVYYYDFNKNEIEKYNVFNHYYFLERTLQTFIENKDYQNFCSRLKQEAHYYFWCKAEYEVLIKGWPNENAAVTKVDIYDQLSLNWDIFCKYVFLALSEK